MLGSRCRAALQGGLLFRGVCSLPPALQRFKKPDYAALFEDAGVNAGAAAASLGRFIKEERQKRISEVAARRQPQLACVLEVSVLPPTQRTACTCCRSMLVQPHASQCGIICRRVIIRMFECTPMVLQRYKYIVPLTHQDSPALLTPSLPPPPSPTASSRRFSFVCVLLLVCVLPDTVRRGNDDTFSP